MSLQVKESSWEAGVGDVVTDVVELGNPNFTSSNRAPDEQRLT